MKKLLLVLLLSTLSCKNEFVPFLEDGIVKCQEDVKVGSVGKLNGVSYKVVDNDMLVEWVETYDYITGSNASGIFDGLNVCTSKVTNMKGLFAYPDEGYSSAFEFNGDISNWDVSNVTNMQNMFSGSEFNGDISNWDVSNVTNMQNMFGGDFNGDISNWDVSNVTNMQNMFSGSEFNGDISNWDVSNVTNMQNMFGSSKFNGDISNWDVSNVTEMKWIFSNSEFNGDISNWVNKPPVIVTKEFTKDCKGKEVALNYLKRLKLSNILWLHDEGYIGGACTGKPNEYCGRVEKFIDGKYWTYDIGVVLSQESCTVIGTWDNL